MNRKVYIAGMITGDPNYREKFQRIEDFIRQCGDIVLNPAVLPEGMSRADYMRICFAMMETADFVVFLPDAHKSEGAMVEMAWCQYIQKPYSVNLYGSLTDVRNEHHD